MGESQPQPAEHGDVIGAVIRSIDRLVDQPGYNFAQFARNVVGMLSWALIKFRPVPPSDRGLENGVDGQIGIVVISGPEQRLDRTNESYRLGLGREVVKCLSDP